MVLTCVTAVFNAIKAGNRERLFRCVESVAALKTEHEHLIYDGASTDGTAQLLRELEAKTPGLKVVSEPDTGIYNALNKGVRDAEADWFYVLGCDDYICNPQVLDRLILNAACSTEAIVTEVYTGEPSEGGLRRIDLRHTLINSPYCHQGVVMRTKLIRKYGGFCEKYKISADFDLFLRCHLDNVVFEIRKDAMSRFASFSADGVSGTQISKMNDEFRSIAISRLNCKIGGAQDRQLIGDLTIALKYFSHQDVAVRCSARYLLWRTARTAIGIMLRSLRAILRRIEFEV